MRLGGDPSRFSLAELSALCQRDEAAPSRAFARRLLEDERAGARAMGERLLRRLDDSRRGAARQRQRLILEQACWGRGIEWVAGVDEAGMGPLAGPVVAAAVIFSKDAPVLEANDSKQLNARERERLETIIKARAVAWSVGVASVAEIADTDIHQAGLSAMKRAVVGLIPAAQHLLVDARTVPGVSMTQDAHVKGDARSCSIAAASILAKVERDRVMCELARQHPGYGFEVHAGYGTPEHLAALRRLGPCAAHRMSWSALADHAGTLSARYYVLKEELTLLAADGEVAEGLAAWGLRVQRALGELSPDEVRRLDQLARRISVGRAVRASR